MDNLFGVLVFEVAGKLPITFNYVLYCVVTSVTIIGIMVLIKKIKSLIRKGNTLNKEKKPEKDNDFFDQL
jgi:hypothetical protein